MERVIFIGLGNMGAPMASNLLKAGYEVVGVDLSDAALAAHEAAGGAVTSSAMDVVGDANVVISMLPSGQHVQDLYLGPKGLLGRLSSMTMVIDCSTVESEFARAVGKEAENRGIRYLDAPVSGGTAGAKSGQLTFIVGGAEQSLEVVRPLFNAMGSKVLHAGEVGTGQLAKMCNNLLLAVQMLGTAEALTLGLNNGLKPEVLSEIMRNSSGGNWVLDKYNPVPGVMEGVPSSQNYQPGFMTALMLKDLSLALNLAHESQSVTPMGSLAENLFRMHAVRAGEQQDFSSVIQMFQSQR